MKRKRTHSPVLHAAPTSANSRKMHEIREAYALMRARFGHRQWWPARTPFEVCVGAILTQNTNWSNVERALANLRHARLLRPRALHALPLSELAQLIRPAGYFNVKARRLRHFLDVLVENHRASLSRFFAGEVAEVRARLLAINGIGPETADSMLLYAGRRLSFVIDAYTKRIFSRHGWCRDDADYDALQNLCVNALAEFDAEKCLDFWRDYHAQLVMIGKDYCRPREPRCASCPLQSLLPR